MISKIACVNIDKRIIQEHCERLLKTVIELNDIDKMFFNIKALESLNKAAKELIAIKNKIY